MNRLDGFASCFERSNSRLRSHPAEPATPQTILWLNCSSKSATPTDRIGNRFPADRLFQSTRLTQDGSCSPCWPKASRVPITFGAKSARPKGAAGILPNLTGVPDSPRTDLTISAGRKQTFPLIGRIGFIGGKRLKTEGRARFFCLQSSAFSTAAARLTRLSSDLPDHGALVRPARADTSDSPQSSQRLFPQRQTVQRRWW